VRVRKAIVSWAAVLSVLTGGTAAEGMEAKGAAPLEHRPKIRPTRLDPARLIRAGQRSIRRARILLEIAPWLPVLACEEPDSGWPTWNGRFVGGLGIRWQTWNAYARPSWHWNPATPIGTRFPYSPIQQVRIAERIQPTPPDESGGCVAW
jgi:hypothetical protein